MILQFGIDYTCLSAVRRGALSPDEERQEALCRQMIERGAHGALVLATCNRTEFWLDADGPEALASFAREWAGGGADALAGRQGEEAERYLFELACGMRSQIYGEDQILAQIKAALARARGWRTADPELEALFRFAVTAAKRVKTETALGGRDASIPAAAVRRLEEGGSLAGARCLVIGNGEIGRLSAAALKAKGAAVTMTVRQYKQGEAVIPSGCRAVMYEERYRALREASIVLSATRSPHYTLRREEFLRCAPSGPVTLVDLALPADIDPSLASCPGVRLLTLDDLGMDADAPAEEREKALAILDEGIRDYRSWRQKRDMTEEVRRLCASFGERTAERFAASAEREEPEKAAALAAGGALEALLYRAARGLEPDEWTRFIRAALPEGEIP